MTLLAVDAAFLQRAVAEHVDAARQAARELGDEPRRLGLERHGVRAAGDGQPMLDVRVDLARATSGVSVTRRVMRSFKRVHRLGLERVEQRRLSAQHDLHEPPAVLLERGQHADSIEHRAASSACASSRR